ncbi:MAG: hypothetical protein A2V64_13280 [Bacteroidetes bacterium RBG_13_43_22]|nr:MAG: hypothetical protein A2V64_13280 [Bacteroidetes bacterium RBG_13_43_22]
MTDRQQMILFQYDFRNAAQHYGFIVDSEGNVFTYNNPGSWNFPDSDFEISQEEVAENTGKCVFSGIRIPDDELLKYTKVIDFIALSKVTAPRITDADKGTAQYICYQFEESSQKYKGHLIKTEGDVTRENLNFHSKRVYTWMKETGNGLSFD